METRLVQIGNFSDSGTSLLHLVCNLYFSALQGLVDDGFIGVKRMGELDITPFATACKRNHSMLEPEVWQEYLSDPSWHPFKAFEDEFGNRKVYTKQENPTTSS